MVGRAHCHKTGVVEVEACQLCWVTRDGGGDHEFYDAVRCLGGGGCSEGVGGGAWCRVGWWGGDWGYTCDVCIGYVVVNIT